MRAAGLVLPTLVLAAAGAAPAPAAPVPVQLTARVATGEAAAGVRTRAWSLDDGQAPGPLVRAR